MATPKRIFIIPYRNRPQQKFFFEKWMSFILENENDYEIYFSHQCDNRSFNRGATKNIGFLAAKSKYPNDYKDITFIFNDVDTVPFTKLFDYQTTIGVVKHYYGFKYTLGGIVVMKGADFEKINGYPNYWGWGNEDNALQNRCLKNNIIIDRSQFYPAGDPNIFQLFDGITRVVNRTDKSNLINDDGSNGINTIKNLIYSINTESVEPKDNMYGFMEKRYVVNILHFVIENNDYNRKNTETVGT